MGLEKHPAERLGSLGRHRVWFDAMLNAKPIDEADQGPRQIDRVDLAPSARRDLGDGRGNVAHIARILGAMLVARSCQRNEVVPASWTVS